MRVASSTTACYSTALSAAQTLSGTISGAGGLIQSGPGTLTLSESNNSFSGGTTIASGTQLVAGADFARAAACSLSAPVPLPPPAPRRCNSTRPTAARPVAGLQVFVNSTGTSTITVGSGKTLTINGNVTMGADLSQSTSAASTTYLTVAGPGSLAMTNTAGVFMVGYAQFQQANNLCNGSFLNLASLSSVSLGTGASPINAVEVGYGQLAGGTLWLSNTANSIYAQTIYVGNSNGWNAYNSGNGIDYLYLGAGSNMLSCGTLDIGLSKAFGTVQFASSSGSVTITGIPGVNGGVATINVGNRAGTNGTASAPTGTLDLRGHSATVNAGTVNVGYDNANAYTGTTPPTLTGDLYFDTGSFTATAVNIATLAVTGGTTSVVGLLSIGGGTVNVGSIGMAAESGTNLSATSGTLTVSGGAHGWHEQRGRELHAGHAGRLRQRQRNFEHHRRDRQFLRPHPHRRWSLSTPC